MKKILALAMAVVMVLALGTMGLAANEPLASGTTALTSASFEVTFEAADGVTTPAFTFTYTTGIGAADANSKPIIYAGVGSISVADVAFAAGEESATGTIDLSGATGFPHAGIYRYTLTQDALSDEAIEVGILNENGNGKAVQKFVDLYVNDDGEILSVVMSDSAETLDGATYADKNDTFANTFGEDGTDDPDTPDIPEDETGTHTVTVTKTISGDMADSNEVFLFDVAVSYTGTIDMSGATWSIAANNASTTAATANIGATITDGLKLKGGESATITVPNNMTVTVTEKTAASEGYEITSTASGFDGTPTTIATAVNNDTTGTGGLVKNADATVGYTNTRDTISPTGVVLRVAPYVFILGAAAMLVVIAKRRQDEENA